MDGASAEPDDESVAGGRAGRPGPALERETMERRKFVIGMGALASGTAAAVGTGAFTQATVPDRSVTVQVAESDEDGALALTPNSELDSVFLNDDDELEIDLSEALDDADGMNPSSELWIGGNEDDTFSSIRVGEGELPDEDGQLDQPAFTIENQTTSDRRVRIEAEAVSLPGDSELHTLVLESGPGGGTLSLENEGDVAETSRFNIGTGQVLTVAFAFVSGTEEGDIEIDLTIRADQIV